MFSFKSENSPNGSYIITQFNYRILRPVPRFHARLSIINKYLKNIIWHVMLLLDMYVVLLHANDEFFCKCINPENVVTLYSVADMFDGTPFRLLWEANVQARGS